MLPTWCALQEAAIYLVLRECIYNSCQQRPSVLAAYHAFLVIRQIPWSTKIVCLSEFASFAAYSKKCGDHLRNWQWDEQISRLEKEQPPSERKCFLYIFSLDFSCHKNLLAHSAGPCMYPGHNISWTEQSSAVGKMNKLRKLAPAESQEALFVRSYRSKPERLVWRNKALAYTRRDVSLQAYTFGHILTGYPMCWPSTATWKLSVLYRPHLGPNTDAPRCLGWACCERLCFQLTATIWYVILHLLSRMWGYEMPPAKSGWWNCSAGP